MSKGTCTSCAADEVESLLDLGMQPVSSHFTRAPRDPVETHPMALAACRACGLAQLARPFPFEALVPPFTWITYREPEAHLDAMVDTLLGLPGVTDDARIVGATYKDRTTLERLRARGLPATRLLDAHTDLGATHPNANIETVHGLLTPARARTIAASGGAFDVAVARHILEHAASARKLVEALTELVRPGGWVVVEVPEVTRNLERQDYAMLWEEHTSYFTAETLAGALVSAGLEPYAIERRDYRFEDIIVAFARKPAEGTPAMTAGRPAPAERTHVALAEAYAAAFPEWTRRYHALCQGLTADGRRLAAYGAGHLTVAFIEYHGLARYFAFVADDTPEKQGLHLPRSGLPIVPGARLDGREIAACFMGFTPEIEDKVIARNPAFADTGGRFVSMFIDSPRSLRGLL